MSKYLGQFVQFTKESFLKNDIISILDWIFFGGGRCEWGMFCVLQSVQQTPLPLDITSKFLYLHGGKGQSYFHLKALQLAILRIFEIFQNVC